MRFSYKELQKYIKSSLPPVEVLAKELTDKAFEVEEIKESEGDFLMEVKVLPDREDSKEPKGLAREIAAIFNLPLIPELSRTTNLENSRTQISFTEKEINSILGTEFSQKEISDFLGRLRIGVEDGKALIPADRSDLNIMEDLADEIGRLYGIEKIPVVPLEKSEKEHAVEPIFSLGNKLREILAGFSFSEIYGYTFTSEGKMETEKPLASDKAFLRTNLTDGLREKLQLNLQNIMFDYEPIKIFEIGTVFPDSEGKEVIRLGIAVGYKSKKFKIDIPEEIRKWGGNLSEDDTSQVLEIDLEELKNKVDWKTPADLSPFIKENVQYDQFSVFPKIIRDLALWVDSDTGSEEVIESIKENAGDLLSAGPILFDEFKKESKTSYAFRMTFQSQERTLTDEEVNEVMEKIEKIAESRGWEVR